MELGKHPVRTISVSVLLLIAVGIVGFSGAEGLSSELDQGQTTELTVNGIWSAPENNGVDLDGLRLMTRPDGIDDWSPEDRQQWLTDNGYDLSVDINNGGVWLHAVETNLMVIPNGKWDDGSLSWVGDILQSGSLSSPLVFWQLPQGLLPVTFAFRTRNGTSGIFRVTEHTQQERTATIQVRLKA